MGKYVPKSHVVRELYGYCGNEEAFDRWLAGERARVWSEGASAMRAAWDVDGEIVEPVNPYAGGDGRGR